MIDDFFLRILYRERWRARRSMVPEELKVLPKAIGGLLGRGSVLLGRALGRAAAKRATNRSGPLPAPRPWWKLRDASFNTDDPQWWLDELEEELEESRAE